MSMLVTLYVFIFFFKQKTAYEMRISDWSSDVCSSDLSVSSLTHGLRYLKRRRIGRCPGSVVPPPLSRNLRAFTVCVKRLTPSVASDQVRRRFPECQSHTRSLVPERFRGGCPLGGPAETERSEERRVGEEGVSRFRYRWVT